MKRLQLRLIVGLLLVSFTLPGLAGDVTLVVFPVIRLAEAVSHSDEGKETKDDGNHLAAKTKLQPIKLSKLARISARRDDRKKLSEVLVPVQSLVGKNQLTLAALKNVLAQLPELHSYDLKIVGPETIKVSAPANPVKAQLVVSTAKEALEQHIAKAWPDQYQKLEIEYSGKPERLKLNGILDWRIELTGLETLQRRTAIWLVTKHNNGKQHRNLLWFKVSGEQKVWLASGDIAAKELTDEVAIEPSWFDISKARKTMIKVKPSHKRFTVRVDAGAVIHDTMFETVPDVEYGHDVNVMSKVGDIVINARATALRNAYIGDIILLRSKSSEEEFSARVVDKNLVEVYNES